MQSLRCKSRLGLQPVQSVRSQKGIGLRRL